MVQSFGINENNDIYIGTDGNLAVLSGIDALLDACKNISRAQLGEEVLNKGQGLPNFETIWVGAPNYALYQSYLTKALVGIPGVLDVASIAMSASGNVLRYTATINTEFGLLEVSNG